VIERDTGAAGTDPPALPHDPDIPALEEIRRPRVEDVFAATLVRNGSFRAEHVLDLGDRPGVIDWDGFRRGARLAKFRRYEPAGRSARLS
jgi:hypothetical protein